MKGRNGGSVKVRTTCVRADRGHFIGRIKSKHEQSTHQEFCYLNFDLTTRFTFSQKLEMLESQLRSQNDPNTNLFDIFTRYSRGKKIGHFLWIVPEKWEKCVLTDFTLWAICDFNKCANNCRTHFTQFVQITQLTHIMCRNIHFWDKYSSLTWSS